MVRRPTAALAVLACAVIGVAPARAQQEHLSTPGVLEGRPAPQSQSSLQALVDAAPPGARIVVPAGTYAGDLLIDKPLTLTGEGRPVLAGSGTGSVIRVRSADVTLEGLDIDGRRGGDLGRDSSGIHVAADRVVVRDCRIRDALFGVYLREADDVTVERCTIRGVPGLDPGEKGSGIHAYDSQRFRFEGNLVVDVRDGLYLQNSSGGTVRDNRVRDVRYGLHYMFSDDNLFEDNVFERGAAGSAIMYSERIVFRRNRFVRNRGFASVGLLLQQCDDVLAEHNLIADNARGVFLEGTNRVTFRGNVVAQSDAAIVLFASAMGTRFEGNTFAGNMSPLNLVGKRADLDVDGNYWSDNVEPDLDGDGRSDRPYRLDSVFDHFRGNLTAADLFSDGFAALALSAAERAFPVLTPVAVVDRAPLARPPSIDAVPMLGDGPSGRHLPSVAVYASAALLGAATLLRGRAGRGRR